MSTLNGDNAVMFDEYENLDCFIRFQVAEFRRNGLSLSQLHQSLTNGQLLVGQCGHIGSPDIVIRDNDKHNRALLLIGHLLSASGYGFKTGPCPVLQLQRAMRQYIELVDDQCLSLEMSPRLYCSKGEGDVTSQQKLVRYLQEHMCHDHIFYIANGRVNQRQLLSMIAQCIDESACCSVDIGAALTPVTQLVHRVCSDFAGRMVRVITRQFAIKSPLLVPFVQRAFDQAGLDTTTFWTTTDDVSLEAWCHDSLPYLLDHVDPDDQ